jgi:hypothetical protein
LAFRMEMTDTDGRPMVVFEEQENIDLGAWELVATCWDPGLPTERRQELELAALAEWCRQEQRRVVDITRSGLRRSADQGMASAS